MLHEDVPLLTTPCPYGEMKAFWINLSRQMLMFISIKIQNKYVKLYFLYFKQVNSTIFCLYFSYL